MGTKELHVTDGEPVAALQGESGSGLTAAAAAAASAGRSSSTLRMTVRESSAACTSPLMMAASHGVAGASCCAIRSHSCGDSLHKEVLRHRGLFRSTWMLSL